jgi:NAD(P)-dependent dehydrogenase (short-subunit alcohol dehydrogenase family)
VAAISTFLNSNSLHGKAAIVTGAGGEIGAATTRLLLARGARVVGVDLDLSALRRLSDGLDAGSDLIITAGDVTSEPSVRDFVAACRDGFGRIDIFFNNAGIEGPVRPLTETSLSDFQRVMDVNVVGVFLGMKHVIPVMVAGGGGAIINTSSTAGLTGSPGVCAYNASKHAVIGLTRSATAEWGSKGIRINSITPGPIASRMMASLEEGLSPGQSQALRACVSAKIPTGRYGLPEEVATMVAFLASDDARYLNGAVFTIDGGYMVH